MGKQNQELKKREREDKRERARLEREEQRRRDSEQRATAEQARRISDLQRQTVGLRAQLEEVSRHNAPAEITVLFLASSPEDEAQLRLDQEIREIEIRLRTTEHRESIRFVPKVARQLTDLVQGLNEVRPHVVHFSGHGNQTELAFAARSRPRASRTDPTAFGVAMAEAAVSVALEVEQAAIEAACFEVLGCDPPIEASEVAPHHSDSILRVDLEQ